MNSLKTQKTIFAILSSISLLILFGGFKVVRGNMLTVGACYVDSRKELWNQRVIKLQQNGKYQYRFTFGYSLSDETGTTVVEFSHSVDKWEANLFAKNVSCENYLVIWAGELSDLNK